MHCRQKRNTIPYSRLSVWQNNSTTFFRAVASAKSDKQLQENTFFMYKSWSVYNTWKKTWIAWTKTWAMQCSGITTLDFTYLPCSRNSITSKYSLFTPKEIPLSNWEKAAWIWGCAQPFAFRKCFFPSSIFEYTSSPCKKLYWDALYDKHWESTILHFK